MPGSKKPDKEAAAAKKKFSRRDFIATGGAVVAVDALISTATADAAPAPPIPAPTRYPTSKGYLVYDSKKCVGCTTCMLSCSLTHYGVQSLSLSRIQIMQDSFGKFPDDLQMAPCRHCVTPPCVINCPVEAAFVDEENGNIRRIDEEKCIGCKTCLSMCPQQPHRTVWNHTTNKSTKCDLCLVTPYWNEEGGVNGKQACVEACPMKAIKFVTAIPDQKETEGYDVNLRNDFWYNLGLVENSTHIPPAYNTAKRKPGGFKAKPKPKAKG
jgi:protein NrfC